VPLQDALRHGGTFDVDEKLLRVTWSSDREASLELVANLGDEPRDDVAMPEGDLVFATDGAPRPGSSTTMPRWGVAFVVTAAR
jgi:hypothetical protein